MNWRDIGDPLGGGAELHLHEILKGAASAGWTVDQVASAYAGAPAVETLDGVTVHRAGHWAVANLVLPRLVRRLLRERRYDLLVEDINKIPFYTPLYAGGVPVLGIVPHLFGRTVYREANPLVATYVYLAESLIPRVYRDVDFEVISPSTRDDLVARGVAPERVTTVYCGIDHERYTLDDPPPRDEAPLVLCWSRLRRYKSNDVAIRAFARIRAALPDARMLIIGRGPDETRLRNLVVHLGLRDAVDFTGYLPHEDLLANLHRAHVFLNPSPKEGWGLTVIEANQCGLPVVASDGPGLRDSVRHGETGSLVPFGDDAAFAREALALLRDPELWRRRSEACRRWAAGFSWPRCVAESLALCERVAARGRRA